METERLSHCETDLLVVGAGAAGMSAALTASLLGLKVILIEKTEYIGGCSALSAGQVWVPNSTHARAYGIVGDDERALRYLQEYLGEAPYRDLRSVYISRATEAVEFLERRSQLSFSLRTTYPDYRSELPDASQGGRVLESHGYDGRLLGRRLKHLRPPIPEFTVLGGMMVDRADIADLLRATRSAKSFVRSTRLVMKHFATRLRYGRSARLLMGNALTARLYASLLDQAVPIWREAELKQLVFNDGRVVGAQVQTDRQIEIRTRVGVVMASGGYPGSFGTEDGSDKSGAFTPAPLSNVGDGIRLAVANGAAQGTNNLSDAFLAPVSIRSRPDGSKMVFPHLATDRSKPGLIAVNQSGKRFVNEARSYHDFARAMQEDAQSGASSAYLICDSQFLTKYPLGNVRPGSKRAIKKANIDGYVISSTTVAGLASALRIDETALTETVRRYNAMVASGADTDFRKGERTYDRFLGDPSNGGNPCLGAINHPPFHAVKISVGTIGTAKGLLIDINGRVLDASNKPVPGLFACGSDVNSIMMGEYVGSGINLGPALTFGYIVACHARDDTAAQTAQE